MLARALSRAVFWTSALAIAWTWVGYPLFLLTLARVSRPRHGQPHNSHFPTCQFSITIIITAYNEARVIKDRIDNCLAMDYPASLLRVIISSDGSTDDTNSIVLSYSDPRVSLHQSPRVGKSVAQNQAATQATTDLLLFTDADTRFHRDFAKRLAPRFADPHVGCVAGRLVWTNPQQSAITATGNLYWRYEDMLWRLESPLGLLMCASGQCFALRRSLFAPLDPHYGDDCILPLHVRSTDHTVVYAPECVAVEARISSPASEFQSRVRMTLRSFAGTLSMWPAYHPSRSRPLFVAVVSHKLLRWMTPYFMIGAIASVLPLARRPAYTVALGAQLLGYALGLVGYLASKRGLDLPVASSLFSFCLTNVAWLIGSAKAILGHRMVVYHSEE